MKILSFFFAVSLSFQVFSFHESGGEPWGADAELVSKSIEVPTSKHNIGQKVCQTMIQFFQNYISPIDGPRSSFCPTSSQYALEAIGKYGVLKGIALGCDRLMRENKENWVYERTTQYESDGHIIERKLDPVR